MADVMTVESLVEVLASIEGRWPNSERRIVACVGRYPHGVEVSSRWLVERFGGSRTNYDRRIRKLVEDQVLIEVEPASGSVGRKVRVNPAIARWRNIPWTGDVARVALWAFSEGQEADLLALSKAGLVRRFVDPSQDRATNKPDLRLVDPSDGGPQKKRRGPTQERATNLVEALGSSYSAPLVGEDGSSSSSQGAKEEEVVVDPQLLARGRAMVLEAVRIDFPHGTYLHPGSAQEKDLARLIEEFGLDAIAELLPHRSREDRLPRTLRWLEEKLIAGAHLAPIVRVVRDERRERIERKLASLRAQEAQYRAIEGDDFEMPEALARDIAACENDLAALDGHEGEAAAG